MSEEDYLVFKVECGPDIEKAILTVLELMKKNQLIKNYTTYTSARRLKKEQGSD